MLLSYLFINKKCLPSITVFSTILQYYFYGFIRLMKNSVNPDQLLMKPANLDLHRFQKRV